jgi:hypothetical protein
MTKIRPMQASVMGIASCRLRIRGCGFNALDMASGYGDAEGYMSKVWMIMVARMVVLGGLTNAGSYSSMGSWRGHIPSLCRNLKRGDGNRSWPQSS